MLVRIRCNRRIHYLPFRLSPRSLSFSHTLLEGLRLLPSMMTDTLAEFLAGKVPGRQVLVHNAHSTQIGERLPGVLKRHSMRLY